MTPDTASFVSIDFETANSSRGSACQIGLTLVLDGEVYDSICEPIQPPPGLQHFAPRNIAVHGMGWKDVAQAQTWPRILERLVSYSEGLPLVAHNAPFEKSVIKGASLACGLEVPDFQYICTLAGARRRWPDLGSHKLNTLAKHLELPEFKHHDAGEDSRAGALLMLEILAC